jgi:hypothetical protein
MRETNTLKMTYSPAKSQGAAMLTGEKRVYTLTELGNPVWTKDKERIRGIFARVAERENDWRMFLFRRMDEGKTKSRLMDAAAHAGGAPHARYLEGCEPRENS